MTNDASNSRANAAQDSPLSAPQASSLLSVVVGVVVVAALYLARDVLVPIMLAVLLAFILAPVVGLMTRLKLGRVPSVLLAVVFALGITGALAGIVGLQLSHLAANTPQYVDAIHKKIDIARSSAIFRLPENFSRITRQLGDPSARGTNDKPASGTKAPSATSPVPVEVQEPPPSSATAAKLLLAPFLAPLETTLIVLVVAVFILLQRQDLRDRLIRLFGSTDLHRTTIAIDDAARRLSRYFLAQLAINTSFGAVVGSGLYFIGVPSPVLWGIVAGLLRFVPYIGAFLAAIPPIVLSSAVDPGWAMVGMTAGLFVIAEPIMGYVVEPTVYGHSTGLSPLAVIVAAIFWTWLWGPIGLILSTPLTLCLVVLGRHIDRLEFIDVLLGDRPALTPIEGFYQRMLAGDVEEVFSQAELLLKERSLSSYYDEVAIPGLQLAISDRRRGVLSRAGLVELAQAAATLVEELSEHDDSDPQPSASEALAEPTDPSSAVHDLPIEPAPGCAPQDSIGPARSVLCIAGPGEANSVVASMLVQLLQRHGIGAASAAYNDALATLPEPVLVCLVYIEITRRRAGIKALTREIARAFPHAQIATGLWQPVTDKTLPEDARDLEQQQRFFTLRQALLLALDESSPKADLL